MEVFWWNVASFKSNGNQTQMILYKSMGKNQVGLTSFDQFSDKKQAWSVSTENKARI